MADDEDETQSPATVVEGSTPRSRREGESALERGTAVGRYLVLDRIGAGGMGVVYAAYDPELNRKVALKLVHPGPGDSQDAQSRMLREAQALARLSHPNVVTVYDVGSVGERVFLAMELVEGETLSTWCDAKKPSWRELVGPFLGAGRGLAAAHASGIIHRDFKPNNVLVGRDGRACVLDFGLARSAHEPRAGTHDDSTSSSGRDALSQDLTQAGRVMGTPLYMPPEAQRGEAVGPAGDQFSYCVALYEALYGARPFEALITSDELPPVPPPPADSRVPAWLRRIVLRGLAFRPEDRFPSMDALLVELQADPAAKRRKVLLGVAGVLALGGLVAGALAYRAHVRAERLAADPCAAAAPFADAWNDAARERVHAAFRASGSPTADGDFTRAAAAIDGRAHEWIAARARACADTRDAGDQPEAVLLLRLECLDQQKQDVAAIIELFARGDADTTKHATRSVNNVPGPAVCANPRSLSYVELPPLPLRPSVDALRGRLHVATALAHVDKSKQAVAVMPPIIDEARRLGYPPLLADALLELCADDGNTNSAASIAVCEECELVALAASKNAAGARAATNRLEIAVELGQSADVVRQWTERSRAWIARSGDAPAEAALEAALALDATQKGEVESSLAHYGRADELYEKVYGDASDILFSERNSRALALILAGRNDEALALQARTIATMERSYGTDTATLGDLLDNYGYNLAVVGRYADARAALERALAMRSLSESSRAAASCDLARVYIAEGKPDEAIALCANGVAKTKAMGIAKFNLAINEDPLAAGYLGAKRYTEALATSRECVAEFRKERAEDSVDMVACLTIEGTALLELGQAAAAVGELDKALRVQSSAHAAPGVVANIQFQLARSLVASAGDRARARELAATARTELARYPFKHALLEELDAWVARAKP